MKSPRNRAAADPSDENLSQPNQPDPGHEPGATDQAGASQTVGGRSRTEITIAGRNFMVDSPYTEGHRLNANEAAALNQVLHENLRNNFAKRVKDGTAGQAELDAYAQTYQFGVRTGGGGRVSDPVERRALELAKAAVEAGIRKSNRKPSDYSAAQITDAARRVLETHPEFRERARQQVEEQKELVGMIGDLPDSPAAPETGTGTA